MLAEFVPLGVVTNTLAVPTLPAGVVAVMLVELTTVTLVAEVPPIVTEVAPVKSVPVIVTPVPPSVVPVDGEIDDTVGLGVGEGVGEGVGLGVGLGLGVGVGATFLIFTTLFVKLVTVML